MIWGSIGSVGLESLGANSVRMSLRSAWVCVYTEWTSQTKGKNMAITLKIKTNNDYSNWTYGPAAFLSHQVIPAVSKLLPWKAKAAIYNALVSREETIAAERRAYGRYPERTWYGLNGVDQYDLWADCAHIVGKRL